MEKVLKLNSKKKILVIGDSPSVPTGFSTVILNVFAGLMNTFELSQIGVNYYGDPHQVPWKQYPASLRGDIWGFNRLSEFVDKDIDLIFILNDVWVIARYLKEIKKAFANSKIPPIVVYFPVDSVDFNSDWFNDFDIVSQAIVYTQFGYDVCKQAAPNIDFEIIPHGTDTNAFYKINMPKTEIKKLLYPKVPEFYDNSFIVLNANRNQPRKKIDVTLDGFKLFSDGKPDNVKIHMHMGLKDAGFDLVRRASFLGIESRLIVTNNSKTIQAVPLDKLNMIYNATDVGINTSWGEGWGLTNTEHAVTGAPQVVPNHSSCAELFANCGILIPVAYWNRSSETETVGGLVSAEGVAESLEKLYSDRELYDTLSKKSIEKFTSEEYSWKSVSKRFEEVINRCLQ